MEWLKVSGVGGCRRRYGRDTQSLGVGLPLLLWKAYLNPSPSALFSLLGTTRSCVPGSYLQCGSVEDNTLPQTHTLAYGHPLPNGDIGAQLWRRPSYFENGGTWGHKRYSKAGGGDRPAPEFSP